MRSRETGVDYVEVRTLDLNSADPVGMNQSELRFIEALLIRCLLAGSPPISAAEQAEIDARDLTVAREGRRPSLTVVDGGRERRLSERGLEVLAEVRAVAELLDADAQGYVAAVDAAAEALREPERTPSAALLAALKGEQASFSEYTLMLARTHAAYFRDFALAAEREQALTEVARRSLEEAEALAAKDSRPFAAFLRDHFSQALNGAGRRRGSFFVIPLTVARGLPPRYCGLDPIETGMKTVFLLAIAWRFRRYARRSALSCRG